MTIMPGGCDGHVRQGSRLERSRMAEPTSVTRAQAAAMPDKIIIGLAWLYAAFILLGETLAT